MKWTTGIIYLNNLNYDIIIFEFRKKLKFLLYSKTISELKQPFWKKIDHFQNSHDHFY